MFDDIERLAEACRFRDCGHTNEPGCAVRAALEAGTLDAERWAHFQKLGEELAASAQVKDRASQEADRVRRARLQRSYRSMKKDLRDPSA